MDHLCFFMFLMLSRLFIAALWSPAGKGLTSSLLLVMCIVFVSFPCDILGQVWHLIVSFPDLFRLSYFVVRPVTSKSMCTKYMAKLAQEKVWLGELTIQT